MPQNSCFVIMPFGPPFDRYFKNVFVPAIEDAGRQAIRADSIFLPSAIMPDIWRFLNEAKVLVADLAGRNPNVFYELGLAHALQKPLILVTNNFDDVP
jgi:nucleoside 2-deoxyribosyltransferase